LTDILGISEARVKAIYELYSDLAIKSRNTSSMIVAIEATPGLSVRDKIFLGYILGRNASRFLD